MTKSFPDPGRKPGQSPRGRGNPPERQSAPGGLGQVGNSQPGSLPSWGPGVKRPMQQPGLRTSNEQNQERDQQLDYTNQGQSLGRAGGQGQSQGESQDSYAEAYPQAKIDPGKRVTALLIDVMAGYFLSVLCGMTYVITRFVPPLVISLAFLLTRDYWFDGRGIGKNLMGLQVVDAASGRPSTLLQSVLRNVVLLAPIFVMQIIPAILRFVPLPWINHTVMQLVDIVGMIYVAIVLPLESYRAYSREDSLRIGDELAGTMIVESQMDFSNPFSR
ncbi:MAG TPA: RDD family protein [Chroococcales cyanobacterium]